MGISEDDENILDGENKTSEEVLKTDRRTASHNSDNNEKKNYLLWSHDQTQQHPKAAIGGSTGGENKQRKAKNGVDAKYHRMDGNAMRRPRETGSRSGAMEDHDSQPSQRRRHLMMMMMV